MTTPVPQQWAKPLWLSAQTKEIDRRTIAAGSFSAIELMERAGREIFKVIQANTSLSQTFLVIAGPGNNGGDALVVARHLFLNGYNVRVFLVTNDSHNKFSSSNLDQQKILNEHDVLINSYSPGSFAPFAKNSLCIIDGLLGLGFKGSKLTGNMESCLREAQRLRKKWVLAIDVPSGTCADVFDPENVLLPPQMTVTFGAFKPLHILSPGRQWLGSVCVKDIGFSSSVASEVLQASSLRIWLGDERKLLALKPWDQLSPDAHKYDRGHVLVIGGSKGKEGAPVLAAMAALRGGAGWVTLAAQPTLPIPHPPELTREELICDAQKLDFDRLQSFVIERKVRAIIVGPGMTSPPFDPANLNPWRKLLKGSDVQIVFDAGALHGLGEGLKKCKLDPARVILTPHPGEWQRLTQHSTSFGSILDIQSHLDQLAAWGVSVFYKSATPIALSPCMPQDVVILNQGDYSLAKAGSGDVLSGIIAAHLVSGQSPLLAMLRGQCAVYAASKKLQKTRKAEGIIASELVEALAWRDDYCPDSILTY